MRIFLIILTCFLALTLVASGDFGLEINLNESYTGNLLNDSSSLEDSYSISRATLHYYPLAQTEINLKGEYTYYGKLVGLGSLLGGAGLTLIPTKAESPFAIYLSGNFDGRIYRDPFEVYNVNDIKLLTSFSYKIASSIQIRSGFSHRAMTFPQAKEGDRKTLEIFGGINASFLGSNGLDFEIGYSVARSNFMNADSIANDPEHIQQYKENLKSIYFSPRFSRPLGKKTGFNLTYTYSNFTDFHDPVVYSYATGYLSPWASIWEGSSYMITLKTFLIPHLITTTGAGFFNKAYLRTLNLPDIIVDREDDMSRFFLNLRWPLKSSRGYLIEPMMQMDISNSKSSNPLYDYTSFSLSLGMNVRM